MTAQAKAQPDIKLPARTIVVGLGPIGLTIARTLVDHDLVQLVGAVDPAPGRAGKDLGAVLDGEPTGIIIRSDLTSVLRKTRPQLAVLATTSHLDEVSEDISTLVEHGVCVVTTAEEMANPVLHDRAYAEHLDAACKRMGVVVVATGVNPGFVMDRLVLSCCQVTRDIRRVEVIRVVDANARRPQLLTKMGAGMSPTTFAQLAMQGGVGHVGLRGSMELVARGLGWQLDDYRESIVPVVARETMKTPVGVLERGQIRGAAQRARGMVNGEERIAFLLEIAAAAQNPRDEIRIEGTPPVHLTVPGAISGDQATVGSVLAAVPFALFARPGLRLPTELPADPRALAGLIPSNMTRKTSVPAAKKTATKKTATKKTATNKTATKKTAAGKTAAGKKSAAGKKNGRGRGGSRR